MEHRDKVYYIKIMIYVKQSNKPQYVLIMKYVEYRVKLTVCKKKIQPSPCVKQETNTPYAKSDLLAHRDDCPGEPLP